MDDDYRPGDSVELFGLKKMVDLNGQHGKVLCKQHDRFVIRLPTGDHAIKPDNCRRYPGGSRADAAPSPQSQQQRQSGNKRTFDYGDAPPQQAQPPMPSRPAPAAGGDANELAGLLGQVAAGGTPSNPVQLQQLAAMSVLVQHLQQQQQQQEMLQRQQTFANLLGALSGGPQQHMLAGLLGGMQQGQQGQQGPPMPDEQFPGSRRKRRRRDNDDAPPPAPDKPQGCVVLVVFRGGIGTGVLPNGMYEIADIEQVFWIFSQFGRVERISVFLKDDNVQALIQFGSQDAAQLCRSYLNGKSTWVGVGSPRTQNDIPVIAVMQSAHRQLTFPKPDLKNREYFRINEDLRHMIQASDARAASQGSRGKREVGDDVMREDVEQAGWGDSVRGFLWARPVAWQDGFFDPPQSQDEQWQLPKTENPRGKVGDCVLLSHLPTQDWAAQKLWGLAGVYGELVAVKMLQKHPDSALIQYSCSEHANSAIQGLDKVNLEQSSLAAQRSKHANALNWKGARSGLERFMCTTDERRAPKPALRSPQPSDTVVLSHIPAEVVESEQAMQDLSEALRVDPAALVVKEGEKNPSYQAVSVEAAVDLVCEFNGTEVETSEGKFHLSMSFQ